jgi:uncharacterized protein (DUF1499 family)
MKIRRRALAALPALLVACATALPERLGVLDGKLAACASGPRCVSSQAEGGRAVPPISYTGSRDAARERLVGVLRAMPRSTVVVESSDYVRAECRSRYWNAIDDVEAYVDDSRKEIQIRSSSRGGWWDFGANRSRVEEIREQFLAAGKAKAPEEKKG